MPIIQDKLHSESQLDEDGKKTGWVEEVFNTRKKIVKKVLFNPETKEVRIVYLAPRSTNHVWRTFSVKDGSKIEVKRID